MPNEAFAASAQAPANHTRPSHPTRDIEARTNANEAQPCNAPPPGNRPRTRAPNNATRPSHNAGTGAIAFSDRGQVSAARA